ncbi:uncharacterized protein zgc:193726 [Tachysurus fulvidraco]|uniref:uncharacterized protein zgc:193726 n=1 Tax=Tachysurus fulvidraco TaxID=1234273 RepID=UPI001FEDB8AC|nr:uncharacterized protein zgc:193726 [Tachysurus fulvidraco]
MRLLWSVSVLLLCSVLGLPANYNKTGNSTSSDDFPTNRTYNFTHNRLMQSPYCILPTCHLHTVDENFQKGDEEAGERTHDPHGPGKK